MWLLWEENSQTEKSRFRAAAAEACEARLPLLSLGIFLDENVYMSSILWWSLWKAGVLISLFEQSSKNETSTGTYVFITYVAQLRSYKQTLVNFYYSSNCWQNFLTSKSDSANIMEFFPVVTMPQSAKGKYKKKDQLRPTTANVRFKTVRTA